MDEKYDIVVLGTGLKECILSAMCQIDGKKVLHLDRNDYYGGENASLTPLENVYKHFGKGSEVPAVFGRGRDWNIDLIPKFLMANGRLMKLLNSTGVERYLDLKSVESNYVYKAGRIHKIPATEDEALASGLMGLFEKRRFKQFLSYVDQYEVKIEKTHKNYDCTVKTMKECYDLFGLDDNTAGYNGHGLALYLDDSYIDKPCLDTILRVKLYGQSLAINRNSPYTYPLYGQGELAQGFARLSAIYGGTYMLNTPCDEIIMEKGKVVGVKSGDRTFHCDAVICDPSYAPDRIKKTGKKMVVAICILDHKIADTKEVASVHIVIPPKQARPYLKTWEPGEKRTDIYVSCVGNAHLVTPKEKDFYLATVTTTFEFDDYEKELELGLKILGDIKEQFDKVYDLFEPIDDGTSSQVFVSKSYDATCNFETAYEDALEIYRRVTGKKEFDLSKLVNPSNEEALFKSDKEILFSRLP